MRSRFLHALAAVLALGGAATAEPPKPAVVIQTQPMSRVLADVREALRQVGGAAQGEAMAKDFEKGLKESLGEKGFDGLDINRPAAAYAVLRDKPEDCGLVVVLPVTAEKDFVAFLERVHIKADAVDGKKGVYELDLPNDELFPKGSHLQFVPGGWAYLTLNDGDPTDPKELVAIGDLLDNADTALVSVRVYPGRLPPKLVAAGLDGIDQAAGTFKMFLGGAPGADTKGVLALLEEGPKLVRRYAGTAMKEAEEVRVSLGFDPAGGEGALELVVVPKPGTALAKDLAAVAPTTNRFAALVTKDAAAAVLFKAPLFAKELRDIAGAQYDGFAEAVKDAPLPEKLRPVVAEGVKGVARAFKAGSGDCAVVLNGPNADGKFTVVAALAFDDPAALDKALRELAKDADLGKEIELDAAKAVGGSVHKVPLHRLLPDGGGEGLAKVFGDKPAGAVAVGKDAVIVAFGPGAVEAAKAALEAKPAAAPALDVTANMSKLHKLVALTDPMGGGTFAKFMGTADKPVPALRVTVAGGEKLTVRVTLGAQILPRVFLVGESSTTTFEKVGEAVKP
ncbi:hypothetical protein [Gemmata sp.]|uniref:hypothetical protein n=1 Tax=Gemmata sp. TaxID=1914242 RepID=UPI003F6E7DB8